ncbi:Peptidyl-tRNA hydrolase [Candidatus Anstonella stagnisolia]|nr:Peptidyl-tRNA hydrolase [Candidatus Anstonella stagnisolia]
MGISDWIKKVASAQVKQAIIVRTDLELGKGKLAGQVAHASVAGYRKVLSHFPDVARKWEEEGEKKVVLKISGEKAMLTLFEQAKDAGIPASLIHDAGLTQITPGTATCFSMGPWKEEEIDKLTSELKLL